MPRTRKIIPKKESSHVSNHHRHWSVSDKKALVAALRCYGFGDLHKIVQAVETKSYSEVESFLTKWKARTKQLYVQKVPETNDKENKVRNRSRKNLLENSDKWAPLEFWSFLTKSVTQARYRSQDYADIFADIFRTAANSEPHVDPRTPEEPNFNAVYNYFASLLSGSMVPSPLLPTEATLALKYVEDLTAFVSGGDWIEEAKFVECIGGPTKYVRLKDEPGTSKEISDVSSATNMSCSIISEPGPNWKNEVLVPGQLHDCLCRHKKIQENINPLCIPLKCLEKEQKARDEYIAKYKT